MGNQMQFHVLTGRKGIEYAEHCPGVIRPEAELVVPRVAAMPQQTRYIDPYFGLLSVERCLFVGQEKCRVDRSLDGLLGQQFAGAVEAHSVPGENQPGCAHRPGGFPAGFLAGVRPDRLRQQNVLPAQPSRPRFGEVHIPEAGDAVNVRITVAGPDVGDQIVPQKIECEQRRPDPERVGETSLCECGKIAAQKRPYGPDRNPFPSRVEHAATAAARSPQRVVEPDAGPARYLLEQNDRRIGKRRDAQIAAIGIGPENAETEISFIVFHRSNGCEEFDLFRAGIVRAGIVVPVSKKDNTMVSSIVSEANDFRD